MKYLITNQNFYKSKLPLFHEFSFLKEDVHGNKATSLTFDSFIQFDYLNGTNTLQIVFDFIIYSEVT